MQVIPLDDIKLESLANRLLNGEVMIYPTETVAGIGSIGSNKSSVKKVFQAKQRPFDKPVSYAFGSVTMIKRYVNIPSRFEPLLDFLPGPLSLILPQKTDMPEIYGIDAQTLGIRIPAVNWLLELLSIMNEPLITTSANISGKPSVSTVEDLDKQLVDQVEILVSWKGKLEGEPSTVVSCIDEPKILREGAISSDKIFSKIN